MTIPEVDIDWVSTGSGKARQESFPHTRHFMLGAPRLLFRDEKIDATKIQYNIFPIGYLDCQFDLYRLAKAAMRPSVLVKSIT
jgi:hypothetical protein